MRAVLFDFRTNTYVFDDRWIAVKRQNFVLSENLHLKRKRKLTGELQTTNEMSFHACAGIKVPNSRIELLLRSHGKKRNSRIILIGWLLLNKVQTFKLTDQNNFGAVPFHFE